MPSCIAYLTASPEAVIQELETAGFREPLTPLMEELGAAWRKGGVPVNRRPTEQAESLLRHAVACNLALYSLALADYDSLEELLQRLSDTDPDSACALLESLASLILSQPYNFRGLALYYKIMQGSTSAGVRAAATEGYLSILDTILSVQKPTELGHSGALKSVLSPLFDWTPSDALNVAEEADLELRMRGYSLLAICRNDPRMSREKEANIAKWTQAVRLAGTDQRVRLVLIEI